MRTGISFGSSAVGVWRRATGLRHSDAAASWASISRGTRLPAAVLGRHQHFTGCRWWPETRTHSAKAAGVHRTLRNVRLFSYFGRSKAQNRHATDRRGDARRYGGAAAARSVPAALTVVRTC